MNWQKISHLTIVSVLLYVWWFVCALCYPLQRVALTIANAISRALQISTPSERKETGGALLALKPFSPLSSRKVRSSTSWITRLATILPLLILSFSGCAVILAASYAPQFFKSRDTIITHARAGSTSLQKCISALERFDIEAGSRHFSEALQQSEKANQEVERYSFLTAVLQSIPFLGSGIVDRINLIRAERNIAYAAVTLTDSLAHMPGGDDSYELIAFIKQVLSEIRPYARAAHEQLSGIHPRVLPKDLRGAFEQQRSRFAQLMAHFDEAQQALNIFSTIAGADEKRRYLLVFQNNSELRPSGGFIGTISRIDIDRGLVTAIETPGGGSYDLKGSLRLKVLSPQPLHIVNPAWQFHDANWFADFPTTAQTLMRFYENSDTTSVDGVIAVNATVAEELLGITGPIAMPSYGKTITKENFLIETQKAVEFEYDKKENKPKKFIADLFPLIIERIAAKGTESLHEIAPLMVQSLIRKDIQLYAARDAEQLFLSNLGITGEMTNPRGDYLMIVHANVGGGKSDAVISEKIDHSIVVQEDGSIAVTVAISRMHHGTPNHPFYGQPNIDFVRLYVPEGSQLLASDGFTAPKPETFKPNPPFFVNDAEYLKIHTDEKIDEKTGVMIAKEQGKTVFGHWMQTQVGTKSQASITYKLPFTINDLERTAHVSVYPLSLQRQSGSRIVSYKLSIEAPKDHLVQWLYPQQQELVPTIAWETQKFDRDSSFAFSFK